MLGAGKIIFSQPVVQYQVVSAEKHTITLYGLSMLHLEIHKCIHIHVCAITMEKEVMNLKESKEGYMEAFGRRKGKGEML